MKRTMMAACILSLVACGGSKDDVASDQRDDWAARQASLVYSFPDNQQQQVPVPAPVVLRFSSPVAETAPNIRIREVGGAYLNTNEVQLEWVDGKRGLTLTPDSKLKPLTEYLVEVPEIELERGKAAARNIRFSTRGLHEGPKSLVAEDDFKVIRTIPDGTNFPVMDFSTFRIQFSQPLDRTTVKYGNGAGDTLRMMGPDGLVEAHVLVSGHYLTVDPKEDLKPGVEYRLELTKSITSVYGDAVPAEGSLDNPNNPIAQRLTVTPKDTTAPGTGQRVAMVQDIADTGELSPLTGMPINLVPMASVLLGKDTATQASGTIAAELAFVPNFPDVTPFRVHRGSLIEGASIEVLIGGEVPAGFDSGKVRMDFLSDATGYLLPNPFSNADDAPRQVRLFMDVAVSTETPQANGAITQDLLHIELVGTSIVEKGQMVINAVGIVEPNVLGSERATGILSFYMKAYEDQDNLPTVVVDTTPPQLQSWVPGDHSDMHSSQDPIIFTFNKPISEESVNGKIHIIENEISIDFTYHVDGSSLIIFPKNGIRYNKENSSYNYRIVIDPGVSDFLGNHIDEIIQKEFSLSGVVENKNLIETYATQPILDLVPDHAPVVLSLYPGFPCAFDLDTQDIASGWAGRCAGGFPGYDQGTPVDVKPMDDLIPVLSVPSNRPIFVRFSKDMDVSSIVLNETFIVEQVDSLGSKTKVDGTIKLSSRELVFYPSDKWDRDALYSYTLKSSGYTIIDANVPRLRASQEYTCGLDAICDEDGYPLQTQPLGVQKVVGNDSGVLRKSFIGRSGPDFTAGGAGMVQYFKGGEDSANVLQVLVSSPISDTNANFFSERNTPLDVRPSFTVEMAEAGATNKPDELADQYFDPSGLLPAPNSTKVLSRGASRPEPPRGIHGVSLGCGYADFDFSDLILGVCPEEKFTFLTGAIAAEVTNVTDPINGVKVLIWPSQIYATSMALVAATRFFPGLEFPVPGHTGPQILRMRYAKDENGIRNQPISAWITEDSEGKSVINLSIDLYLDAPYLADYGVGVPTVNHEYNSYEITMNLYGEVRFLDDGRLVVEQYNSNLIDISSNLYNVSGDEFGYADLYIPERGSYLQFVSKVIK